MISMIEIDQGRRTGKPLMGDLVALIGTNRHLFVQNVDLFVQNLDLVDQNVVFVVQKVDLFDQN